MAVALLAACATPVARSTPAVTPDVGWAGRWERAVRANDGTACRAELGPGIADRTCAAVLATATDHFRVEIPASEPGSGNVRVEWRVTGEPTSSVHRFTATFEPAAGRTRLSGLAATQPGPVPIWLLSDASVHTRDDITTLGRCPSAALEVAGTARDRVRGVELGDLAPGWRGHVVVECPPSEPEFTRLLGVPFGSYRGLAAVAWPYGSGDAAAVHVVLNPSVVLDDAAAAMVLRHEIVHVATRSYRWRTTWVTEGVADAVAADPTYRVTSNDIVRADARRGGAAPELPANADFAAATPEQLNVLYGSARLAVDVLVDHVGWQRSRAILATWAIDPRQTVDGVTPQQLTQWWRQALAG